MLSSFFYSLAPLPQPFLGHYIIIGDSARAVLPSAHGTSGASDGVIAFSI